MAERPPHTWTEIPEGHEVVAVVDPEWDIDTDCRPCRRAFGRGTKACGKPSAAVHPCGYQGHLWGYCPEHMYGRWVEEGFVMHWILVKVGSDAGH